MSSVRWGLVAVAIVAGGCGADAANLDAAVDAANLDAANLDAANLDAANLDAANLDAAVDAITVVDAAIDAGAIDAATPQGILVAPTMVTFAEPGGPSTATVWLGQPPASPVTVALSSSDPGAVTVAPATLTFTAANYAIAQPIVLEPVDDVDTLTEHVTVTATAVDAVAGAIAVVVIDNSDPFLDVSLTALTVAEGGTGTFFVRLQAMPGFSVTVTITTSDPGAATAAPTTVTIAPANWNLPHVVTVAGVDDADPLDETVDLTVSSPGLSAHVVTVTVRDDDAP